VLTMWVVIFVQDHIYSNLSDLLNQHLLHDSASTIGTTMVDMGRVEMLLLRSAYNVAGGSHLAE
jgi:hypothetical protein